MVLMEFLWDFWKPLGKNDEKGMAVCFHPDSLEQTPAMDWDCLCYPNPNPFISDRSEVPTIPP